MALVWENWDDRYGPRDVYVSVAEFQDMCRQVFGQAPELTVQRKRYGASLSWKTVAVDSEGRAVLHGRRLKANERQLLKGLKDVRKA